MDFKMLYQNMLEGKYSDFELTLCDPDETIILKLHKIILDSYCPYFHAMFSFDNKKSSDKMEVDDVNIMKDVIMSFYQEKDIISEIFTPHCGDQDVQWYYLLQRTKCNHYLGLETRSKDLYDLKVPPEGFDLLWQVVNHYDITKNEKLLWLVKNNLPENHDLSSFPQEIATELSKPDYLGVFSIHDSIDVCIYNLQQDKYIFYRRNDSWSKRAIRAIFSSNNKLIAISYSDQTINIMNLETDFNANILIELKSKNDGDMLLCMQFSSDDKFIAGGYASGFVNIWEISTGIPKYLFKHNNYGILYHCIKFSPDGKFIAAATKYRIFIWNLETSLQHSIIKSNNIINISFLSNNQTLILANDGNIEMWDINDNICLRTINLPDKITKIAFCPDAKLMAIVNDKHLVSIYDMESGNQKNSLRHPDNPPISNINFSSDGKFIATSGGGPKIWHTESGNYIKQFPRNYSNLAFA